MAETRGYAWPIRLLHWSMALLIIAMIIAGLVMVNGPWDGKFPPERGMLYDFHRGVGFILLPLAIVRLALKFFVTPPSPLPDSVSKPQRLAAEAVHVALYVALIAMPLFGWYATNAWGVENISVFGLFDLPPIASKNRELGNLLLSWHGKIGFGLAALIVLHAAAALHHQFILKDGTLSRMISS